MSLQAWAQFGWLNKHQSSPDEIKNLLAIADRDLEACRAKGLGTDWSFTIAYNAALQCAIAALAAAGYRASHDSQHYRVFQSLEHTIGTDSKVIRQLDVYRKKRNVSSYEVSGSISEGEASGIRALAAKLRTDVREWISKNHPQLLK